MSNIVLNDDITNVVYNDSRVRVIKYKKGNNDTVGVWNEPYQLTLTRGEGIQSICYKVDSIVAYHKTTNPEWRQTDGNVERMVGYGDKVYYYVILKSGYDNLFDLPTTESSAKVVTIDGEYIKTLEAAAYHTVSITPPSTGSSYVTTLLERYEDNENYSKVKKGTLTTGSHIYKGDKIKATINLKSAGYTNYTVNLTPNINGGTYNPLYLTSETHNTWTTTDIEGASTGLRCSQAYVYPKLEGSNFKDLSVEYKVFATKDVYYTTGFPKETLWQDSGSSDLDVIEKDTRPYYFNYNKMTMKFELWLTEHLSQTNTRQVEGMDYSTTLKYGLYNVDLNVLQLGQGGSSFRLNRNEHDSANLYKSALKVLGLNYKEPNET